MVEFIGRDESLPGDDSIPETLKVLLARVASDYLPEIEAMMVFTNNWLAENNPEPNELAGGESLGRGIGMCQFTGTDVSAGCASHLVAASDVLCLRTGRARTRSGGCASVGNRPVDTRRGARAVSNAKTIVRFGDKAI